MIPGQAQSACPVGREPCLAQLQGEGGVAGARTAGSRVRALSPPPQIYGWVTESLPVTGCAMHHFPGAPPTARASPPTPTPSQLGCCQRSGWLCWETPSLGATGPGSKSSAVCSLGHSVCPSALSRAGRPGSLLLILGRAPGSGARGAHESPSGQAALGFLTTQWAKS